ncbi:MAG TPA: alanine racemase [Nitrospiria bacterium]|nr:alanine racemase [Nitrospiria bacterium]
MGGHPTFAEIDLQALASNLKQVSACVGKRKIMGVVKANAYGHGAARVARHLEVFGVGMLGVAYLVEAVELREAGINLPILLLAGCQVEEIPDLLKHRLTPVVFDEAVLEALGRHAVKENVRLPIHVKIDTGMGRIGVRGEGIVSFIEKAVQTPGIQVEGILSHFAEADIEDRSFAVEQIRIMKEARDALLERGIKIPYSHMANSAAVMELPEAHFNLVRPGLMLYGYSPFEKRGPLSIRPILRLLTRISALKRVPEGTSISYGRTFTTRRESLIATLPIGYADGYPRSLSNRGEMIIRGKRVAVVGRVCMDMTMIDVTAVPDVSLGDRVTVIGEEGSVRIWADELARWASTIPYEILCGIGRRVPRYYRGETPG